MLRSRRSRLSRGLAQVPHQGQVGPVAASPPVRPRFLAGVGQPPPALGLRVGADRRQVARQVLAFGDAQWADVSLPNNDPRPGVSWDRSAFPLNVPAGVDASLGLTISDQASKSYRAQIFLNGWNVGQYVNGVGPQSTFVLPAGLLNLKSTKPSRRKM
jgi:hypothetical protein